MIDYERVLAALDWLPDEMEDGKAFFEGVVPRIGRPVEVETLARIAPLSPDGFEFSCWHNDTPKAVYRARHEVESLVEFFRTGTIVGLTFDYEREMGDLQLDMRLMFEPREGGVVLLMLCRRDALMRSGLPPMLAIRRGIEEFDRVYELLDGDALFVAGPESFDIRLCEGSTPSGCIRVR